MLCRDPSGPGFVTTETPMALIKDIYGQEAPKKRKKQEVINIPDSDEEKEQQDDQVLGVECEQCGIRRTNTVEHYFSQSGKEVCTPCFMEIGGDLRLPSKESSRRNAECGIHVRERKQRDPAIFFDASTQTKDPFQNFPNHK